MSEAITGPPLPPPAMAKMKEGGQQQQQEEEEAVVVESRTTQSRLDVPKFPLGGDANTVAQAGTKANYEKFGFQAVGTMVSMREVLDLNDWDNCRMVLPVGQSGVCGSQHYQDQVELWRHGELHPMPWSRAHVEKHTESVLLLTAAAPPPGSRGLN
jgi:penicillin amidase